MSEEPVTFGQAISAARRKLGMSQKQLAERIRRERRRTGPSRRSTSTTSNTIAEARLPIT